MSQTIAIETIYVTIDDEEHPIRVFGTSYNPGFAGKDLCKILGFENHKKAIFDNVQDNHKKELKNFLKEENYGQFVPSGVVTLKKPALLGPIDHKNLSHNDGRLVVLIVPGVMDLLNGTKLHKNKNILKNFIERWIWTIKYEKDDGLMDFFSFIKRSQLAIDLESNWFRDLWYPLSRSQGLPGEALKMVQNPPFIITQNLIEWMGYKGRKYADKQNDFIKLLESLKIQYNEIDYKHPLAIEYLSIQEEIEVIPKNNIERKRWICMEPRAFKNVVMRLNTQNADMVRDYYLNLEDAVLDYGRYVTKYLMEKTTFDTVYVHHQLAIKNKAESELREQLAIKDKEAALKDKVVQDLKEELEDTKEHALVLQELLVKDDPITRTQVIYIATTKLYAKNNNFKPGGVDDNGKLRSRLSTYNTGRVQDDQFYYSDTFNVSNYHIIEAQLKNLLFRFRDKKQKEMYRLHYSDMRYIVEYLCKRDGEDVEEVNTKLTQFISNLNKRNLRPIVPPPTTAYLTSITQLKEDGTVNNVTIQTNSLEESIKRYILALEPQINSITKKKVFDDLKIRKKRKETFPRLEQLFYQLRPDIVLMKKPL